MVKEGFVPLLNHTSCSEKLCRIRGPTGETALHICWAGVQVGPRARLDTMEKGEISWLYQKSTPFYEHSTL